MDLELEKIARLKEFTTVILGNNKPPYDWTSRERRDVIKGLIEHDDILGIFKDKSEYLELYKAILLNDLNFIDGVIVAKMTDTGVFKIKIGSKSYFTGWDIVDLMEVER